MKIYQIFKLLPDGTPDVLCGAKSKELAWWILHKFYPEECGYVVWNYAYRRCGDNLVYDGRIIK